MNEITWTDNTLAVNGTTTTTTIDWGETAFEGETAHITFYDDVAPMKAAVEFVEVFFTDNEKDRVVISDIEHTFNTDGTYVVKQTDGTVHRFVIENVTYIKEWPK